MTINGEEVTTTPEHPFLRANGEWTPAGELAIGATLRHADGSVGRVQAIAFAATPQVMYNMTVADAHTYTVGDGAWAVHNQCRFNPKNLQHEFKHAVDFGITGNWNKANGQRFEQAVQSHIATAPQQITGTFREATPVTHYFDPATNLWAVVDNSGTFVAGWKLYPSQVIELLTKGNVR